MEEIRNKILKSKNINKNFVDNFYDTLNNNDKLISYNEANKWIGFKKNKP